MAIIFKKRTTNELPIENKPIVTSAPPPVQSQTVPVATKKLVFIKKATNAISSSETKEIKLPSASIKDLFQNKSKIIDTGKIQPRIVDTGKTQPKLITKKVVEEVKKRGRPSKEEIEKREKDKLEEENRLKDELIQKANQINLIGLSQNKTEDVPIFKVGEFVKDAIQIGEDVHKGVVFRQDLDCPRHVFVSWKDGSRQWHGASSLTKITEKEYKKKEKVEVKKEEELKKEQEALVAIEEKEV